MLYIEARSRDAAFYFSAEEYLMRNVRTDEPVMMLWQTDKCVMLGNYQVTGAEINLDYARAEGMQVVRRPSGGGTIFTDMGTILYTVILPYTNELCTQKIAREQVAAPVIAALSRLGVPAKLEGRNDILVDGKKISGLAQHAKNGRLCTHGSLLYDTDLDMLTRVLNVEEGKISSKAIRSVRSRVTNIKEHMSRLNSTREFWQHLKHNLFEDTEIREYSFSDCDLEDIDRIYHEKYGNPSWVFEKSPRFSYYNSIRFEQGKVEVYLDIVKGVVAACSIRGDFLGTVPIRGLEERLEQQVFQYQDMLDALDGVELAPYLGGITKGQLLSCMF